MTDRPQSEKLIELHVYVIPSTLWQDRLRSAVNQVISETISAGFIRIRPESTLTSLREIVVKQLGSNVIPKDFIFCKSVGRCLTQVRINQENDVKAHHFLPPNSYCPELFLLDLDTASKSTPSLKNSAIGLFGNSGQASHGDIYNNGGGVGGFGQGVNSKSLQDGNYGKSGNYGNDGSHDSHGYQDFSNAHLDNKQNSGKDDYFRNTMTDGKAIGGKIGDINLDDYPNLTPEEIRMLQGMSPSEIKQYLINNGHINSDTTGNHQTDSQNKYDDEFSNSMYEDSGPLRGVKSGQQAGIPSLNVSDSDFDDSHMTEIEKYKHYVSLLEKYKNQRSETDYRKEDMIKRAKQLFTKTANQKNIARDMWKKRYFEEKKRSPPMEDHLNKQRADLDAIHRKILGMMESLIKEKKSAGANQSSMDLGKMRLEAKKVEYEIEEAQRSVDEAKLKLTCEIKMTHQARAEVVALRADLVQKKINLSMTRSQHLTNMGTQDMYRPARVSLVKPVK